MNLIKTIALKEFFGYITSPIGYIFAGLLMTVTGWLYFGDFFVNGQADLGPYWSSMIFLLSIFIPAISMNLIAEEKKNSTWEVMLSLPISETEYVVGKFLGAMLYLLSVIALTIPVIVTVVVLGKPDAGIVAGGVAGVIFLSAAYLALGLFASSLSNQPIVGFLTGVVLLLINNLLGQEILLSRIPEALKNPVAYLSLSWHSANFTNGVIGVGNGLFYISWVVVFVVLTVLSLKARGK